MKENATKIQNAYRIYKAKKEKDRLKNINNILEKYVLKKDKTNNDILRSKLRKWYNKTKMIIYNENSRIIQRFIRPKLYKLLNDRFKKFFYNNSKKKIYKYISQVIKINKLNEALNKPKLYKFMNNLQTIVNNNIKKDNLKNTINDIDDKNNLILLKTYLQKWRNNSQKLEEKINDNVSTIQRAFKTFKANNKKNKLKMIKQKLTISVLKKGKQ